jgi:hypothetical protein
MPYPVTDGETPRPGPPRVYLYFCTIHSFRGVVKFPTPELWPDRAVPAIFRRAALFRFFLPHLTRRQR